MTMAVTVESGDITQVQADVVVVNLFEGVTEPSGGTGAVDAALGHLITDELAQSQAFKGKLGDTLCLHTHGKL
ncbi:MAG: leucyl aminopeptidase, partial [Cyanobacteria bacterium HKST-UBA03]|nr:leucyl aminopeptidase [Cyanobacteria bacterium HKST-UBA03]